MDTKSVPDNYSIHSDTLNIYMSVSAWSTEIISTRDEMRYMQTPFYIVRLSASELYSQVKVISHRYAILPPPCSRIAVTLQDRRYVILQPSRSRIAVTLPEHRYATRRHFFRQSFLDTVIYLLCSYFIFFSFFVFVGWPTGKVSIAATHPDFNFLEAI